MQPSHAISDLFCTPRRLGDEQLAGAYAWQSLLKTGAIIAAGSDAPVERGEPIRSIFMPLSRAKVGTVLPALAGIRKRRFPVNKL